MTTAYTSLLGFALPVEGELDGAWGNVVNNSITELVEDAIAATATASVTSGDWTLTTTGSGATNQARCAILVPTGSPGVTRNIIAPSSSKAYIVDNQSNASVVVKGSATTGVTISTGVRALVAWTGTDFVLVASGTSGSNVSTISFGSTGLTPNSATSGAVTVAGTLAVANGGTGQTSYTDGQLLIGNSTGNTLAKATLTAGSGISITNGSGSITIAATGGGGGSGTVTSVGLTMPSGFSVGSSPVTTSGTIAVTTSLSGVLKGTGSGFTAAVAGTDYVTPTGSETLTNKTLTNPTITNYTETTFTANTGTALTLDLANGTIQVLTLTGNATITMPTATAGKSFLVQLKTGAGSFTCSFNAVKWPGGTAPTVTSTASRMDIFSFFADGTNWYGTTVGQNYTP
jgi:hypothetical protein